MDNDIRKLKARIVDLEAEIEDLKSIPIDKWLAIWLNAEKTITDKESAEKFLKESGFKAEWRESETHHSECVVTSETCYIIIASEDLLIDLARIIHLRKTILFGKYILSEDEKQKLIAMGREVIPDFGKRIMTWDDVESAVENMNLLLILVKNHELLKGSDGMYIPKERLSLFAPFLNLDDSFCEDYSGMILLEDGLEERDKIFAVFHEIGHHILDQPHVLENWRQYERQADFIGGVAIVGKIEPIDRDFVVELAKRQEIDDESFAEFVDFVEDTGGPHVEEKEGAITLTDKDGRARSFETRLEMVQTMCPLVLDLIDKASLDLSAERYDKIHS